MLNWEDLFLMSLLFFPIVLFLGWGMLRPNPKPDYDRETGIRTNPHPPDKTSIPSTIIILFIVSFCCVFLFSFFIPEWNKEFNQSKSDKLKCKWSLLVLINHS